MATIRKRGESWQVQVRRIGHPALSRTFKRKADAELWARQIEAEADRCELPVGLNELRKLTLSDIMTRYAGTISPKKRGVVQEVNRLRLMARHSIANVSLARLSSAHIAAYRDERLRMVSSGTVHRDLALLSHVIEIARREWGLVMTTNPVSSITKPQPAKPRTRRLNDQAEAIKLLDACAACRNPFVEPLVRIALETGMRRSELSSILWEHIDWRKHTLHVPVTKNGHRRTIPLTSKALKVLEALRSGDCDPIRVFPMSPNAIRLAWVRLTKRAGIEDLRFHDLRHEAVSRFFEMGLSMPEVAMISGHRDYRMLARYTHLRAEDVALKLK